MKLSVMKLSLRHGLYDMYIYPGNPIVSEMKTSERLPF